MAKGVQVKHITDHQVCAAYARCAGNGGRPWPYERLAEQCGAHINVAFRACERAHRRGLIEYGTSIRSGWLTDTGKEVAEGEGE